MEQQSDNIELGKVNSTTGMLVSVVVITYNSAKYVLETLESAKSQTYQNIELIISDDCSTDKTVDICNEWIKVNGGRFIRTQLITTKKNTGIPANCNRGVRAAIGEWIKFIAGDDVLDKNCIRYNIDYLFSNPKASVISSSIQFFVNTFRKENFNKVINPDELRFFDSDISAYRQYNMLLRMNYVHGPSVILKKTAILDVGGFDEKYHFLEDHPILLKLTEAGYKIYSLNKITAFYRRHDSSVLRSPGNTIFSDFYLKKRIFTIDYIHPNIPMSERIADNIEFLRLRLFDKLRLNRDTYICRLLFLFTSIINPAKVISNKARKKSLM